MSRGGRRLRLGVQFRDTCLFCVDFEEVVRERKGLGFFLVPSGEAEVQRGQVTFPKSCNRSTSEPGIKFPAL